MGNFLINNPAFLQSACNGGGVAGTFYLEAIEDNTTVTFTYPSYQTISRDDVEYEDTPESLVMNSGERIYIKTVPLITSISNPDFFSVDKEFNAGGLCPIVRFEGTVGPATVKMNLALPFNGTMIKDASKLVVDISIGIGQGITFKDCVNLIYPPKLPAKNLSKYCYKEAFSGCTSLALAPKLPAGELTTECYLGMFRGCISLVSAPKLPAKTLALRCYKEMFSGCSSLSEIVCLAENINEEDEQTTDWMLSVQPTGTFIKAAGTEWPTGVNGIPEGWTIINQ